MYITQRFQELKKTAIKTVTCKCGKKLKRQRTFTETLNPFNRLPSGEVKNVNDIEQSLKRKIEEWKSVGELCRDCVN